MKKKIVAFLLVLVLLLAIMVPCFALVTVEGAQNSCNHRWVCIVREPLGYEKISEKEHCYKANLYYHCSFCSEIKTEIERQVEDHAWVGNICKKCGAPMTRAMES